MTDDVRAVASVNTSGAIVPDRTPNAEVDSADDILADIRRVAPVPLVVHVYGDVKPPSGFAVAPSLRSLRAMGWRATLVVPATSAWDGPVRRACGDGHRALRAQVPAADPSSVVRALRGSGMRARWLSVQDAVVLHAHDDAAAAAWGAVARRARLPMVWDVDVDAPSDRLDPLRIAGSSYLLTMGHGARLSRRRKLPRTTLPRWDATLMIGDVRVPVDDAAPALAVFDEVYQCLTGIDGTALAAGDRSGRRDGG